MRTTWRRTTTWRRAAAWAGLLSVAVDLHRGGAGTWRAPAARAGHAHLAGHRRRWPRHLPALRAEGDRSAAAKRGPRAVRQSAAREGRLRRLEAHRAGAGGSLHLLVRRRWRRRRRSAKQPPARQHDAPCAACSRCRAPRPSSSPSEPVPHGEVAAVHYQSTGARRAASHARLHAAGLRHERPALPGALSAARRGDNDQSWLMAGRANFIFDNLIAAGKGEADDRRDARRSHAGAARRCAAAGARCVRARPPDRRRAVRREELSHAARARAAAPSRDCRWAGSRRSTSD